MGHIPNDAEWYIAELVMEIIVHGSQRNALHRNLTLIRADSPQVAYDRALQVGQNGETEYFNPKNQLVNIRFRGISKLDVMYEPLEDGAELCFQEEIGISEAAIQRLIQPKEKLDAFTAPNPGKERDPDYRSKAVVEKAVRMIGTNSNSEGWV
jgi:hypothetical protein